MRVFSFRAISSIACVLFVTSVGFSMPADWFGSDATSATGAVAGVGFTATTSSTAPFDGLATHRFAHTDVPCGGWDAEGFELAPEAVALTTTWVNGGDWQQFDFDGAWGDGLFYIENFDSSSRAMIMLEGGGTLELLTASKSVSYDAATSTLSTSNDSFDGEGDAAFRVHGPVTSIRVDYKAGEQANGIFYTFADGRAIPEPASLAVWGLLAAMIVGTRWFSRRM